MRFAGIGVKVLLFFLFLVVGFGRLRETQGFQFLDALQLVGSESFTLCLVAFHADKLLHINLLRPSEGIVAPIDHEQSGIGGVGEQQLARVGVLAQVVLLALRGFHEESLHVGIALVVGIVEHTTPYLVSLIFLEVGDVVFEVYVGIESRQVVVSVLENHQYLVAVVKLA